MKNYDFILRFDDDNHSMTAVNGISIWELSELLLNLNEAVNYKSKDKIVLSEIKGNCYALKLTTDNEFINSSLKLIHSKISNNDYSGFNNKQLKYAGILKSITKNELSFQAYDNDKDYFIEVNEIIIPDAPTHFNEIIDVYGIITSIGGTTLEGNSFIKINTTSHKYNIKVDSQTESKLLKYYKKDRLLLTINRRINYESKEVTSAELIDFEVSSSNDFFSNLNENDKLNQDSIIKTYKNFLDDDGYND